MNSDLSTSTLARKNASAALKKVLYTAFDEDTPDLEEKVENLTQILLEKGLSAFETQRFIIENFDEIYRKIVEKKAYQEYLNEHFNGSRQRNSLNYWPEEKAMENNFMKTNSARLKRDQFEEQRVPGEWDLRIQDLNRTFPITANSIIMDAYTLKQERLKLPIHGFQDSGTKQIAFEYIQDLVKPKEIQRDNINLRFCDQYSGTNSFLSAPQRTFLQESRERREQHFSPANPVAGRGTESYQRIDSIDQNPLHRKISTSKFLLTETFRKLRSHAEEYDRNFTLILDLSTETLEKEFSMLPIIQKHKENDFATLFNALKPLLFDLLKRREDFEDFTEMLNYLAKREKISSFCIIKQLQVRDILLLLLESCSQASLPQLGLWLSYQFYPLPLISLLGENEYKVNLNCCLEYLFQVKKPLITSIGTRSAQNLGKSSFLSYLFSTRNPDSFSTKDGLTHFGAVDMYVNLPSDQQPYILADVHSYGEEDERLMDMLSRVLTSSQIILVHLTDKDIFPDGRVNLNFKVKDDCKVIYLWRDYNESIHSGLLALVEQCIQGSQNVLDIVGIPQLNVKQTVDMKNDKFDAMQRLIQKIDNLKMQDETPIVDLFKIFELDNQVNGESQMVKFGKEFKEVNALLNKEFSKAPNQGFTESLLPHLWNEQTIFLQEKRKRKLNLKQIEVLGRKKSLQSEEYEEIQDVIEECKRQMKTLKLSPLIQKMIDVIASNEIYRISILSEVINNWKMPQFQEIRHRFIDLSTGRSDLNLNERQKRDLTIEMDDKDLGLNTFLDEILSYYESNNHARNSPEYKGIKNYLSNCISKGAPLNLVNGKTLKFGSELIEEIFNDIDSSEKIFVISIIGAQSSAKSTLLNVLFGCSFSTSAGRCTKGIYISLHKHPSGFKIVVIDTGGLLSVVARDLEYDNLITTMAFSCSHVVIINNKGEITTKLRDLLEICVYAMKHLDLNSFKPKIIFALRDIADNGVEIQQDMLLVMRDGFDEAAKKLCIDINCLIDFSLNDICLLPSAFQFNKAENKTKIRSINNLFPSEILEMRKKIFRYIASDSVQCRSVDSMGQLYRYMKQGWKKITKHGSEIMKSKNLPEIKLEDKALEIVYQISEQFSQVLLQNARSQIDSYKNALKQNFHTSQSFPEALDRMFTQVKNMANSDLEEKILRNDQFAIISNYFNEFMEIVSYDIWWQKQRFVYEWNASFLSWQTDKEIEDFKSEIKMKVNQKLGSSSNLENLASEIMKYFKALTTQHSRNFEKHLEKLRANIHKTLPAEILSHFEHAIQAENQHPNKDRVFAPMPDAVMDIINGKVKINSHPDNFFQQGSKVGKEFQSHKATIMSEIVKFRSNLDSIIDDEPSTSTAHNILKDATSRIRAMSGKGVLLNRVTFMNYCLLEAIYFQYQKVLKAEMNKIQEKDDRWKDVIEKEKIHVITLLENSLKSDSQDRACDEH